MSKRKLQPHDMLNHSQDIQLCDLVSHNPCLYDPSLTEYKEATVRERAWEDIAANINVPIDICKSRWRNIRDCYRRNKKWRTIGFKGDFTAKPRKVYVLNEYLEFLDRIVDDERRSVASLQQQHIMDDENMVPNIEILLDDFGQEFKQEKVDDDDGEGEKGEEEEDSEEGEENQNVFNTLDAFTSTNVTSTCNFGTMQTYDIKTSSADEFNSSRKKKAAISKIMLRKLYKKAPSKVRNRFEPKQNMSQSKRQKKIENECHTNVINHEDDTQLFFRSMAMTCKAFHPVILAGLKKKICATVMDAVLENEKLSSEHSNVCHSSKSASYLSDFSLLNKQDDYSEVT